MAGPLSGIKLVEFVGIGPGPFCGMILADLGAEVIRIDRASQHGQGNTIDFQHRSKLSLSADLKNPKTNKRNAGFTDEERSGFENYIQAGFLDTFRMFNNEPNHYTWWSYMFNSRAKNVGWRIDYFCISKILKSKIKQSIILPEVMGSDHAPILIEIDE